MPSSGVISGSLNQLRLPRGTTRIPIAAGTFLTNITIVGDTFQIATLDEFILDTVLKPSASLNDVPYTVELFNETTGLVLQSFDCKVSPVSAPDDQSYLFTINVVDVTHFYSLRITATQGGNPDFIMSLSGPTFTMVISSLTSAGGGAPVSATPPIFVAANNITLGQAGSNATSPTTPDAASSVTWSPFSNAFKALVLQGKAGQTANLFEAQSSAGAILAFIDPAGNMSISGKLTVAGAIDPTSLSLTGANNAIFVDWEDGQNVPVGVANHGRIIYNAATQTFQASQNGGAFTPVQIGTPTLAAVLASGNTTGAHNILISAGQQIDTAVAGVLNLGNTTATAAGIGNPAGGLSAFQVFINQGGAALHGSNAGLQFSSTTANRAGSRYNQYGANAGVPGITGFKSRGATVGSLASVADGDTLWRATAIGVAGDNATIPLAGFISIQVPTGGTQPTWVATDFALQLVPLAGPINSRREVFKITSEAAADFINGTTAPVTVAGHGAIRYNNATPAFEVSLNTGAWTPLLTGASFTATAPLFFTGTNLTLGAAGSNAVAPTTADANSSVTWSPFNNAHKALVLQGKAGQATSIQEWQDSTGAVLVDITSAGSINTGTGNLNLGSAGTDLLHLLPTGEIVVGTTFVTPPVSGGGPFQFMVQKDAGPALFGAWAAGGAPGVFFGLASQGTLAAPAPSNNGDLLFLIAAAGFGSDSLPDFNPGASADIGFAVDGVPTPGYVPSQIFFGTKPAGGAGGPIIRMTIRGDGFVGVNQNAAVGTETFGVTGDVYVGGKLTVTGAIDPTSLSLTGANNLVFIDWEDGQNVPVSAANHGRIRYNANTQLFEASQNGAAYVTMIGGGGSTAFSAITSGTNTTATMTVGAGALMLVDPGGVFGQCSVGGNNTIVGSANTGPGLTGGSANDVLVGDQAGFSLIDGINNTFVGQLSGNSAVHNNGNTFVGKSAGTASVTGDENVCIGHAANVAAAATTNATAIGKSAVASSQGVSIGFNAGVASAATNMVAVGANSGFNALGSDNTFVGTSAGNALTTGTQCVFFGSGAGSANTASTDAILIGFNAASTFPGTSASSVITIGNVSFAASGSMTIGHGSGVATSTGARTYIFGASAGTSLTSAADNIFIGFATGASTTTGGQNVFIGTQAGQANTTAVGNTFVGYHAGEGTTTGARNTFVGNGTAPTAVLAADNTLIGYHAGINIGVTVQPNGNTIVGSQAGTTLVGGVANGFNNVIIGYLADVATATDTQSISIGQSAHAPSQGIVIGVNAGFPTSTAVRLTVVGSNAAGAITSATDCTFVGESSGAANATGSENVFIGSSAGLANVDGSRNVFIGFQAGVLSAGAGDTDCTLVGWKAGNNMNGTGIGQNACFGTFAGEGITTGFANTYIGYAAGGLIAGNNANTGVGNNCIILSGSSGSVAIGKQAVVGNAQISIGSNVGFDDPSNTGAGNVFIGTGIAFGTNSTASNNTLVGNGSMVGLQTGSDNVTLGFQAGAATNVGVQNVFIGSQAGAANTGDVGDSVYVGCQAGLVNTTSSNVFIGALAGLTSTTGRSNTIVGTQSDVSNVGDLLSIVLGQLSLAATGCITIGNSTGVAGMTGANVILVGGAMGANITTAADDIFIGSGSAAALTTGTQNIFIGTGGTGAAVDTSTDNIGIGYQSMTALNGASSNNVGVGNFTLSNITAGVLRNTAFGDSSGASVVTGGDNVFIGSDCDALSGTVAQSVAVGSQAWASDNGVSVGFSSGSDLSTGVNLTLIGVSTGVSLTSANDVTLLGFQAGMNLTSGDSNTFLGSQAGLITTTGTDNICVGRATNLVNAATIRAVVIGSQSIGTDESVVIGYNTGINQTTASSNVLIGKQTGNSLTSGQDCVFVGWQTGTTFDTGSGNVAIGAQIAGSAGAAFCTLIGNGITSAVSNDLQIVSGDTSLVRTAPGILAFTGGSAAIGGGLQLTGIPTVSAPPVAPANSGRIYYDSTLQQFMFSKNGGAYVALTIP